MGGLPKSTYFRQPPLRVFGQRLRRLRQAAGWSQEELGHRADRSFAFVSSIERAERNITFMTILRLAEAFDLNPAVLVTTDEEEVAAAEKRIAASRPLEQTKRRR